MIGLIALAMLVVTGAGADPVRPARRGGTAGAARPRRPLAIARYLRRAEARAVARGGRGLQRGPVLETARLDTVRVHAIADELAPELVRVLRAQLGVRVVTSSHGYLGPRSGYDVSSVWLRDYHPHFVRDDAGELEAVTFLSINPARSEFLGDENVPVPAPRPGDRLFRMADGSPRWLRTRIVPLVHEHGNLVSTGDRVLVTEKLFEDNAVARTEPHLRRAGYRPRTRAEVLQVISEALRVDASRIVVLPRMPGERTGHVDAWALALGPSEVLVPEVREDQLAALGYAHERELGHSVRQFLDAQARHLGEQGFIVHRLPMLAPVNLSHEHGGWKGNFYSPANSLVADVAGQRLALLPAFDPVGFPDDYRATNGRYLEEWKTFFTARGYRPIAVDATRLARANGLLRCLTAVFPE